MVYSWQYRGIPLHLFVCSDYVLAKHLDNAAYSPIYTKDRDQHRTSPQAKAGQAPGQETVTDLDASRPHEGLHKVKQGDEFTLRRLQ